jgi:predicted NodU family carbamoyl transferase
VRILGINCFSHDTAACLLEDGRLVALAEEERFNRERHTKRFPDQAIDFCLSLAGIGISEAVSLSRPTWGPLCQLHAVSIHEFSPVHFRSLQHRCGTRWVVRSGTCAL